MQLKVPFWISSSARSGQHPALAGLGLLIIVLRKWLEARQKITQTASEGQPIGKKECCKKGNWDFEASVVVSIAATWCGHIRSHSWLIVASCALTLSRFSLVTVVTWTQHLPRPMKHDRR